MGGRRGIITPVITALTVLEVAVQQDRMMMKGNKQVVGGEIILLHTHIIITEEGNIRHPQEDKEEEEEEGVALEVVIVEVDPIAVVVLTCQKEVEEGRGGVAMMIWMVGVAVAVVVGKMDANIDETEEEAQEVEVGSIPIGGTTVEKGETLMIMMMGMAVFLDVSVRIVTILVAR